MDGVAPESGHNNKGPGSRTARSEAHPCGSHMSFVTVLWTPQAFSIALVGVFLSAK